MESVGSCPGRVAANQNDITSVLDAVNAVDSVRSHPNRKSLWRRWRAANQRTGLPACALARFALSYC